MNSKIIVRIIALAIAVGLFGIASDKSFAKTVCFTQYGGGETCVNVTENAKLDVSKTIYNPKSGQYEDHIKSAGGSNPYIFDANESIKFKITIKNTGDVEIKDINMYDVLPMFLQFKSGEGNERKDGKEIKFEVGSLKPGEEKLYTFKVEINNDGISPNANKVCLTNTASAKGKRLDSNEREESIDYSNFCITLGQILGIKKERITVLPKTGGQDILIGTFSVGLILVGYGLKKL